MDDKKKILLASTVIHEANGEISSEERKNNNRPENLDLVAYAREITEWVYKNPRRASTIGLGGLALLNPATAMAVVMTMLGLEVRNTIAGSLAATIRKEITPALRNSFFDFAQGAGKSNEGMPIEHGAMATESQEAIASKLGAFSDPKGSVKNEAKAETAVREDVHGAISKGKDDESKAKDKKVIKDGKVGVKVTDQGSESASNNEERSSNRHGRPKL
ncbi:MAG: hypothetical protein Q9183_003682 [Haloplaca sp. 2 TL-2023]